MKRFIALLSALVIIAGSFSFYSAYADEGTEAWQTGDIVELGSYPQAREKRASVVNKLNEIEKNWTSYGYYGADPADERYSQIPNDNILYSDIEYDGTKYRAVKIVDYRKGRTDTTASGNQYYNGYKKSNVYYFKYQPLKWMIVDADTGLAVSENVLDAMPYQNTYVCDDQNKYWDDDDMTIGSDNYLVTDLRSWLNNDFYNLSFTSDDKAKINKTTYDKKSFGYIPSGDSLSDNVSVPTYDIFTDEKYNLNSFTKRRALASDYSSCLGADTNMGTDGYNDATDYKGCAEYWTRTIVTTGYNNKFYRIAEDGTRQEEYVTMVVGVRPAVMLNLSDFTIPTHTTTTTEPKTPGVYDNGDIITYGTYPQTLVSDDNLRSSLESVEKSWNTYSYYSGTGSIGTAEPTDSIKYADIEYGGDRYRAVTFVQPRAWSSYLAPKYFATNGYKTNTVYYFKYEPIKWRILDKEKGILMSESLLDAQPFNETMYRGEDGKYYCDKDCTHFAGDWRYSSVRKWLNTTFYDTVFTTDEKKNIITAEIDNTPHGKYYTGDTSSTQDNVYLPGETDMHNTDYGFAPMRAFRDENRLTDSTDYAKSQGLWTGTSYSYGETLNSDGQYILRTSEDNDRPMMVRFGEVKRGEYDASCINESGIRPMITVDSAVVIGRTNPDDTTGTTKKTTTSTTTTTTTTTTKRNNAPSYSNTTATTKTTVPKTTACPHRSVSVSVKKYATFSSDGKYSRVCKNCKKTLSTHSAPKLDTVSFKTSYTYSGTALKPTVTVKDKYKKAVSSSYYSVTYISRANNKSVSKITSAGQYIAKVKFKGIYSGEKTFYFSVKPAAVTQSTPSSSKKSLTAKWKSKIKGPKYQVCISENKNFKNAKIYNASSAASKKITGLKSKKKYYVRIRSYQPIKVDGQKAYVYSSWSNTKTVKTK